MNPNDLPLTRSLERWYLGSMNDGLFIIDRQPRPSTDDVWHERPDGPSMVLNVTDLPNAKAQAVCDAHNVLVAALAARVAELEEEIKALHGDRAELILALQPLLGCADYAREHDLSGHETLVVTASEAYEANSIHERVLNRAAKAGGDNG